MQKIISLLLLSIINCELQYVVEVFRHGAREKIYGDVPNKGELTSVGQRQHFLLGDQLRQEYIVDKQFLSPDFDQKEIKVISTDFNRTLESARSQLEGFYPLGTGQNLTQAELEIALPQFNNVSYSKLKQLGLLAMPNNFQPIPIHTDSDHQVDNWNNQTIIKRIQQQNINSEFYRQLQKEQQDTIKNYIKKSGNFFNKSADPIGQIANEMDNIMCDYYKGLGYPQYLLDDQELFRNMSFIYNINFYANYYSNSHTQAFFTKNIFKLMEDYSKLSKFEDQDNEFKWLMLSAHDTTISSLLSSLNITSKECIYKQYHQPQNKIENCQYDYPYFTSNLIFEYYKTDQDKYIMVRYNGQYRNLCGKDSIYCDYKKYQTLIDEFSKHAFPEYDSYSRASR